ncbi:MAG: hypothetical protein NTY15_15390 [Planctomycetota bacterium]|nr:hypothetical protein [Planctomycetota bacterium]
MNTQLLKNIVNLAHHRNGICGAPFYAVLFNDSESYKLGIVFDSPYHVAILDFDRLVLSNITFGENSYRGDLYEAPLRAAIAERMQHLESTHHQSIIRGGGQL